MPVEFTVECSGGSQLVVIEDDGTISMPGYDPDYDMALAAMSPVPVEASLCYALHTTWQEVLRRMDKRGTRDTLSQELTSQHYDIEPVNRYYDRQVERGFNLDDLGCLLADLLKDCIKDEDPGAELVASIITKLPLHPRNLPDIDVDEYEQEDDYTESVVRRETHTLKICETEVAEWEEITERRIYDIFYFQTDVSDLGDAGLETGPSEVTQRVLDALGLKDPDPDFPDEWDVPQFDKTGQGNFGVLYEEMRWHDRAYPGRGPGGGYDHDDVADADVIIYDSENEAREAHRIATKIQRESGDHQYRITLVRRKAPSERRKDERRVGRYLKKQAYLKRQGRLFEPGYEQLPDPPPPHPIYSEWVELEESHLRPSDFEG